MRYFNLKYISLFIFIILILLLILYSHFLFEIKFKNEKVVIRLKIKLLFKLIRINIQLYPPKKKSDKKKGSLKDLRFLEGELHNIIDIMKKIKLVELYSDIYLSNTNPYITIYVNALINAIYGNIINIFNCEKIYLNITPKFVENNIEGSVKIHIKFRVISFFKGIPIFIRVLRLKLKSKEGDINDSY